MKLRQPIVAVRASIWEDEPVADVWWGASGIDALIWADPIPYGEPADASVEAAEPLMAGDPR